MTTELIADTASNLAAVTKGEIDSQIATAKAYPRDIAQCKLDIRDMACADAETAAQMFYAVPRAGKTVEGPSVRLAEVVAYSWQNIRFESRIIGADDSFVTAQATVMDLERNTAGRGECKRRITNKQGKKFSDDMVQTTCNAACAIALREAIFRVVPRVMFESVWKEAKAFSVGEIKSTIESAAKAIAWFSKSGVVEARVLAAIGRESIAHVTADDIATLRGITTALKENTVTLEDAFPPLESAAETKETETVDADAQDQAAVDAFRDSIDFSDCATYKAVGERLEQLLVRERETETTIGETAELVKAIDSRAATRRGEIKASRGTRSKAQQEAGKEGQQPTDSGGRDGSTEEGPAADSIPTPREAIVAKLLNNMPHGKREINEFRGDLLKEIEAADLQRDEELNLDVARECDWAIAKLSKGSKQQELI